MALIDDVRALDAAGWAEVWPLLLAEAHRRQILATSQAEAERIAADYLAARDRTDSAPAGRWPAWVRPTGAHDAYPVGYQVTHGGRVWRSTACANAWEPGAAGVPGGLWVDVTDSPEPAEPGQDTAPDAGGGPGTIGGSGGGAGEAPGTGGGGEPEPYTPPSSPSAHPWEAGVPYYEGDLVTWKGATWRVLQEHSSQEDWTPDVAHSLYERAT